MHDTERAYSLLFTKRTKQEVNNFSPNSTIRRKVDVSYDGGSTRLVVEAWVEILGSEALLCFPDGSNGDIVQLDLLREQARTSEEPTVV